MKQVHKKNFLLKKFEKKLKWTSERYFWRPKPYLVECGKHTQFASDFKPFLIEHIASSSTKSFLNYAIPYFRKNFVMSLCFISFKKFLIFHFLWDEFPIIYLPRIFAVDENHCVLENSVWQNVRRKTFHFHFAFFKNQLKEKVQKLLYSSERKRELEEERKKERKRERSMRKERKKRQKDVIM